MARTAILLTAMLMLVPLAFAQEANETATDNSTDAHPTGRPTVCSAEVDCAGGTNPYGTCMDGVQGNESCDANLYYMSGPARGPADGSCENCRNVTASGADTQADSRTVPALGVFAVFMVLVVGVALLATKRQR